MPDRQRDNMDVVQKLDHALWTNLHDQSGSDVNVTWVILPVYVSQQPEWIGQTILRKRCNCAWNYLFNHFQEPKPVVFNVSIPIPSSSLGSGSLPPRI